MTQQARREDILVSVCLSALAADAEAFEAVRALAARLDARFRFREIVLVADAEVHEAYLPLVRNVANVRLLALRPGHDSYDRRVIAADEAIGDVVLITRGEELPCFDLVEMIEQAADRQCAMMGARHPIGAMRRGLWGPVVVLGRMTGFSVGPREMQTLALPRTLLNQLLATSDPELALRFPPRDMRFPLELYEMRAGAGASAAPHHLPSRLRLVQRLLSHMAPRLLVLVNASAGLLALTGFFLILYTLGAWIVVETLAPGWLTTMGVLSLTAIFLGISILGLSLALQQLLLQQRKNSFENVAREVNRIDLFGQVASDLNVDVESGGPAGDAAAPGPAADLPRKAEA